MILSLYRTVTNLSKNNLIRKVGLYGGFSLLNSAVPFLALPYLTSLLSPTEYAYIDLFNTFYLFLTPIVGLSVHTSITRFYYDKNKIDFAVFFTNSIYFLIFCSSTLLLIYYGLNIVFVNLLSLELPNYFFLLCVIYTVLSQVYEVRLALWRVQEKVIYFGFFRVGKTVVDVSLSLLFVYGFNFNWQGHIAGLIISSILFVGLSIPLFLKDNFLKFSFNLDYIKRAISYGLPLILHIAGGFLLTQSSKIIIVNQLGKAELGIYAVAFQISMVISLIVNSFNLGWVPFFYKLMNEDNHKSKKLIVKYLYSVIVIFVLSAIFIMFLMPYVYKFYVDEKYSEGISIANFLVFGFLLNAIYRLFGNFFFYNKKTMVLGITTLGCAVVNIILNYTLIPFYGLLGSAFSSIVSFAVLMIVLVLLVVKKFSMPWLFFLEDKSVTQVYTKQGN